MQKDLLCDGCSRESWPDGSLVLVMQDDPPIKTVRNVRVRCGAACKESAEHVDDEVVEHSFGTIDDVFDYADRVIAAHDWERGTVQRLSRVLAAIHQRRAPADR